MNAGDTIHIKSGTYHDPDKKHLFVVCTDPCANGKVVIAPVSTWTNHLCDPACKIADGEHVFINHLSYIFYRKSRIEDVSILQSGVAGGFMFPDDPVEQDVLERVKIGICESEQTPKKVKNYFGCPPTPAANTLSTPG